MLAFKQKKGSILVYINTAFKASSNKPVHESNNAKVFKVKQMSRDREPEALFKTHFAQITISSNYDLEIKWERRIVVSLHSPFDVYRLQ